MKKCLEYPDKRRFNTKKEAETALLVLGKDLRIYKCATCKGWHFSSKDFKLDDLDS